MGARIGRDFLLVRGQSADRSGMARRLKSAFERAGLVIRAECAGARPNSPVEDVLRVRDEILSVRPGAVVGLGGGSLLDALKGSITLAALGGSCKDYYGVGKVSEAMKKSGRKLLPMLAVQTASALCRAPEQVHQYHQLCHNAEEALY